MGGYWQVRIWIGAQEPLVLRNLPNGPSSFDRQRPGGYRYAGNTPAAGLQLTRGSNPLQFLYAIEGLESERQRDLLGNLLISQDPPSHLVSAGVTAELGKLNFEDQTQRINIKEIIGVGSRVIVPGSAIDIDGNAIADADLPAIADLPTYTGIAKAHFRSKCILVAEDSLETLRGYDGTSNLSDLRFNIIEILV